MATETEIDLTYDLFFLFRRRI